MSERRKRLIEVAFPLEEVSTHSRREKNIRHGHISTLHTWWARRPLAACRAFIYASLVDDPDTDAEREELLKEVADLASWDAVRHAEQVVRHEKDGGSGLTGTELLKRARERILACNDGKPPKLLDPFAGGGAIPLEGLRLGCEVEASDLNPVAVLILKCTLEYPQRYGQPNSRDVPQYILDADAAGAQPGMADGEWAAAYRRNPLATDVRYWGTWMLDRAKEELAEFYPPDPDGSVPVAYLWSRTIPCPSCDAEMPLIRQYWLARSQNRRVALEPVMDAKGKTVDFRVVEGPDVDGNPAQATTSRGDTRCLLCGQVVKAAEVRRAGVEGKMSAQLTSVVVTTPGKSGKRYREDVPRDVKLYDAAALRLAENETTQDSDTHSFIPDEPTPRHLTGGVITAYGFDEWGKLFNARQLLALTTFARLVGEARTGMHSHGIDTGYSKAVSTFLGMVVDRLANFNSSLALLKSAGGRGITQTFARQALPMVWDHAECNPFAPGGAAWLNFVDYVSTATENLPAEGIPATAKAGDAGAVLTNATIVVTDPPYYDAINYADLSDFFYVWLKRSVGAEHPELLSLPLTPKREQTVMNVNAHEGQTGKTRRKRARQHYVDGISSAFKAMAASLEPDGVTGVVFAHTDPDAWSTLIEGLIGAGLVPDASWPIDTELQTKVSALGQARLKTSVWMACRKRGSAADDAFLGDVLESMRPMIRERLLFFWTQGIRGADFFISAIGPALSVFGRHARVLNPDGSQVLVRDFLNIVRRESTAVALEQILHGADLGAVDSVTRNYVTWVWSHSRAALDAG